MPYSIRYEPAPGAAASAGAFLDVRLWGTLTQDEFDDAAESIGPALHEWHRVLLDAADLDNAGESFTMFLRSGCRGRIPPGQRQAAVIGPDAAAVARSWVRVASQGSAGTQAFPARAPAVAWLAAAYQATTGGS